MNITVIKSSPRKNGASNFIADEFLRGAAESGNETEVFDIPRMNIQPCLGCNYCKLEKTCCHNDELLKIQISLMKNDMIVFVTPMYYSGMVGSLKTVIDRFYAFEEELCKKNMKSLLITAAHTKDESETKPLRDHYRALCRHFNLNNVGELMGVGCGDVAEAKKTEYPFFAYKLGQQIC